MQENIIYTLKVLLDHTDEDNKLTQQDFVNIISKEYGVKVDRRSISRNIEILEECGYPVQYETFQRKTGNETVDYHTNYWIEHPFTEGEANLLLDSVLFSKHMDAKSRGYIIDSIYEMMGEHFKSKSNAKNINAIADSDFKNDTMVKNVDTLCNAIHKKKQISVCYGYFTLKGKLEPNKNPDGTNKEYILSPYYLVANRGFYYLIAFNHEAGEIRHYRLDRMAKIKETPRNWTPLNTLEEGGNFNINDYMTRHINMFSGDVARVEFTFEPSIVKDVRDWFGNDIFLQEDEDGRMTGSVVVGLQDMELWALQYATHVKIVSPALLAEKVKANLQKALSQYD